MCKSEDVQFSLKVLINKQKTKVLYAKADNHLVDVLLSFLTLPLGTVIKILGKHYGNDEAQAPVIGSLNTMYNGLANLDSDHFCTESSNRQRFQSSKLISMEAQELLIRGGAFGLPDKNLD
ncbi:hypothetical protein OROMI_013961 [Orobanche minor]